MKLCKCGCGKEVTKEENIYLIGHQRKNISPSIKSKIRSVESIKKQKETIKKLGKGFRNFCLCGCGQKVKHPHSKYCLGHNQIHKPYYNELGEKEKIEYGKKISESKLGKTKENCEHIRKAAEKITGLTKENCECSLSKKIKENKE